jgi:polyisoprenoid-binding protein YceI
MRKLSFLLGALTLVVLALPAAAATYTIDKAHSSVGFKVKHLTVSNVRGFFKDFAGTFDYDPANPKSWRAEATIQVASIDTDEPKRDEHLRSADFFDAATFPTMTFKSTGVNVAKDGAIQLLGDLTLHGVTKPIVLDLEVNGVVKDPWGNTKAGFSASGKIKRSDFGLTWNKTLDSGGLLIGDEVSIMLEIEAAQNK